MPKPEHANPGNKGGGKGNAPGQQAPGSTRPAPGRSGEAGGGHSEENRTARQNERAAERAAERDQSEGGAPSGDTDGTDPAAPDPATGALSVMADVRAANYRPARDVREVRAKGQVKQETRKSAPTRMVKDGAEMDVDGSDVESHRRMGWGFA